MSWKLVRDRHKERLESVISGSWRVAADPVSVLVTKLGEEYGEFASDRDPSELYDLLDVLDELVALLDPHLEYAMEHELKTERLGRFSSHLEWHPNPYITWGDLEGADTLSASDLKDGAMNEQEEAADLRTQEEVPR